MPVERVPTPSAQWTMRQSLSFLTGSALLFLALSLGGYWIWVCFHQKRLSDPKYQVRAIVQTGPQKEALQTAYLAELLGLSIDHPSSLYAIDCRKFEQKLLASPCIRQARVKRMPPNTLYIDYEVRQPIAILADYQNTAIDREGYLFPIAPFFPPKELPELYLGLPPFEAPADAFDRSGGRWLTPLQNPFVQLAFEILQFLDEAPWKEGFCLKRLDVSNALEPSLGQREVVLVTEEKIILKDGAECVFPKILRLAPRDYDRQLDHFFTLRRSMEEDYRKQLAGSPFYGRFAPRIIDLRIPQIAFIENR